MRFLCDMGVALRVVEWLRREGHDAAHVREEGLGRAPNGDIFHKALTESRVVITFDLDFGEIVAFSGTDVPSVIILRLNDARAAHVIERLAHVLAESGGALESGAVVSLEETRHRVRRLPIPRGD